MTALEVRNLTKIYRLYDKPSSRLKEIILRRPFHREFIALNNITFTVKKGETLGIIGENGAGKSTLLKILSKTLSPTSGEFKINGRVSSLLELGSGFHPEFTGMENIFFYGSLLGIDRATMQKKVADIVEFAELGDFINYPIKTYSSGMFVRLAFSVAMAVDPEILIIDEVLAVGDLHFQKKSTEKILSFKQKDKAIVFCSHSMYYINRLCDRAIWLKNGKIEMEGAPHQVTQAYETYQLQKETGQNGDRGEQKNIENMENGTASLIRIRSIIVTPFPTINIGDDLNITIEIETTDSKTPYQIAAILKRIDNLVITGIGRKDFDPLYGDKRINLCFPSIQLKEGTFLIDIYAMDEQFVHVFDMKASDPFTIPKESVELGFINIPYRWSE